MYINNKNLLFSILFSSLMHVFSLVTLFSSQGNVRVALVTNERISLNIRSSRVHTKKTSQVKSFSQKKVKSLHQPVLVKEKTTENSVVDTSLTLGDIQNSYLNNLRELIEKNKYYPSISKKLSEQGAVQLEFNILENGEIQNILITKSSGHRRLDQAAIETVLKIKQYDPIPKELFLLKLTIIQNIKYELKSI